MDELELLKQRADTMGIKYSPNIGVDTLKAKIEEAQAEPVKEQTLGQLRAEANLEEMKLIRVRIANMNPAKADLNGEIFTVANKIIGTVRKFVPYGEATDNGYHIPNVIYKQLLARKFQQVRVIQGKGGHTSVESKWVPEFSLEVLPQLTQEELNKLASQQAAATGLGS